MNVACFKRIVFAGGGSPLLKLIKIVKETQSYNNIEIAAVFVPETETEYFRQSLADYPSIPIVNISHIERNKFKSHHILNNCDYLVSFNNMFLIDDKVIRLFRCGGINYHAGSLPEYAGSYTYQWAIRNKETEFASSIHWIDGKADAGPIICKRYFPLSSTETGLSALMKCTNAAIEMMKELFRDIDLNRTLPSIPQDPSRRRFYTLNEIRNSGRVDWNSNADDIGRLVRAADFSPLSSPTYEPYTETRKGVMKILKISPGKERPFQRPGTVIDIDNKGIEVATGSTQSLILTSVILDGKKYISPHVLKIGLNIGDSFGYTKQD